jgi:carboxylesterase
MPYQPLLIACLLALLPPGGAVSAAGAKDDWQLAWETYAAAEAAQGLQFGCQPRRYRPPAGAPGKGLIIAIHGFSACPQQFFQLGPLLASRGFEVLVPVLPGHGFRPRADGTENLDQVPDADSWAAGYGGLAEQMNQIAALAGGERILIGYSLGGAMAINAALRAPDLYARLLLVAPLIEIRGGAGLQATVNLLGRTPGVREWGPKPPELAEACADWTAAGRTGFCDYRLAHIPALIQLAAQNRDWLAREPLTLPTQIILAEEDVVISNAAVLAMAAEQPRVISPMELCTLTGDVPHEIFTPYENAGRKMTWLPRFLQVAESFVVSGEMQACGPQTSG